MANRDDIHQAALGRDLIHDPEAANPILPQTFQLPLQRLSGVRIIRQHAQGLLRIAFDGWWQMGDLVGHTR